MQPSFKLKPLALFLLSALVISQPAFAGADPILHEEVSVTPGRTITPTDEAILSSSASKVLHHISRARNDLRRKDGEQASMELKQAEILLDIIQNTLPTTMVKDRVWTADDKLKYESVEEVPGSIVPIYASLGERADFDSVKLAGAAKTEANGDKQPQAAEETEARDAELYYEELDLPMNATRHFIAAAQNELARKRYAEADHALRAAMDNVDYAALYLPAPLLAASINLERADAHFDNGQMPEAKADVNQAITQLSAAEKQADPGSLADVKQMLVDAQSLQTRMDSNEPGFKAELTSLWQRIEANADRTMAYTSFGWARLRQHDPLRSALIESKRYVAYADIDANVAGDANKSMHDLEQAKTWLDKAVEAAAKDSKAQDLAVNVKDIRAVVETLLAGQAKPDANEMANHKQQLTQTISHS